MKNLVYRDLTWPNGDSYSEQKKYLDKIKGWEQPSYVSKRLHTRKERYGTEEETE